MAPDKRADLSRQVARKRVQTPQRRELLPAAVPDELEHPDGTTKIAQTVLTQINQPHAHGKLIAHHRLGGAGNDKLPTMGDRHQPGSTVDCRPAIVPAALLGLPGVHTHPHPHPHGLRPALGGEPDLGIGAVHGAGEIAGLLCGHGVNIR